MLFSDSRREARALDYRLAPTAVAALSRLREQTFPQPIAAPRFTSRTREAAAAPPWLGDLLPTSLFRQALLVVALAAAVLLLAIVLPTWGPLQRSEPASARVALHSSAGVTGTAETRLETLNAATFVGRVPFVQQLRYFGELAPATASPHRFVQGAREATLVGYLQDVGTQVTLPYLQDAAATNQAIGAWAAAEAEAERLAAVEAARQASLRAAASGFVWQAPALGQGTRLASTVTFYACVGDGFCNTMASGEEPFNGAAACSNNLPFGTRFVINSDPSQRVFVCMDRGALAPTWVDIWFYDVSDGWAWQSNVGTSSDITIIQ